MECSLLTGLQFKTIQNNFDFNGMLCLFVQYCTLLLNQPKSDHSMVFFNKKQFKRKITTRFTQSRHGNRQNYLNVEKSTNRQTKIFCRRVANTLRNI